MSTFAFPSGAVVRLAPELAADIGLGYGRTAGAGIIIGTLDTQDAYCGSCDSVALDCPGPFYEVSFPPDWEGLSGRYAEHELSRLEATP